MSLFDHIAYLIQDSNTLETPSTSPEIQSHDSSNKQQTFWSYEETKLFIQLREEKNNLFNSMKRTKQLWREIVSSLQAHGYVKTIEQCQQKWKNLQRAFRETEEYNAKPGVTDKRKCLFYDELAPLLADSQYARAKSCEPSSKSNQNAAQSSSQPNSQSNSQTGTPQATVSSISIVTEGVVSASEDGEVAHVNTKPKRQAESQLTPLATKAPHLLPELESIHDNEDEPMESFDSILKDGEADFTTEPLSITDTDSAPAQNLPRSGSASGTPSRVPSITSKADIDKYLNFFREQSARMSAESEKAREIYRFTMETMEKMLRDFTEKSNQRVDRHAEMFERFLDKLGKN
ncbi:hypothetical protein K493DRAFT_314159 [Basidiobolus meristosporus CBS 931.73]|uniref:Myb-like domain-containing protein n=1 Tax=Basidiobolus meristosporus CBS 931.73 TaxID=1314790 RepID=A0A1Y1YH50_9FUNG|nr:hypothetical protein K493DRAFT_314159 [Basidiobolus meristosporus CBS 931.73]|eukprot:ORX97278.1 hypothetical protein K493DRAFT_314159 [Basidiobolus meristosporus CBS 931.73]